ncbi:hypothetical protein DSD31_22620 [Raoultella sp. X13]|nr:hypothetical protein DSD31_22620 [Raoultella sp. X13]
MPDRTCLSGQIVYRQKRKKPVGEDGLLTDLMPGRLWRAFRPPSGRCFATFKSAPGGFVLLKESLSDKQQIKQKAQSFD